MLRAIFIALLTALSLTFVQAASAANPPFALYLPVPPGATVEAGGPHNWTGDSNPPFSSVDIGMGLDTPMTVYAAATGIAHIYGIAPYAACWVEIDHTAWPGDWRTRYMHLINIDPSIDGQRVWAGQRIGDAGFPGQDTCGTGDFRHVHFALFQGGNGVPIDGTSIGGYVVHSSGTGYCGSWTRNSNGATVRSGCGAGFGFVNDQSLPPALVSGIVPGSTIVEDINNHSYVVGTDGKRRPVPSQAIWSCLTNGYGWYDVGVFGAISQFQNTSVAAGCPAGDVSADNHVNIVDLSMLLTNYGTASAKGDANFDGHVDVTDLSILLTHYGM